MRFNSQLKRLFFCGTQRSTKPSLTHSSDSSILKMTDCYGALGLTNEHATERAPIFTLPRWFGLLCLFALLQSMSFGAAAQYDTLCKQSGTENVRTSCTPADETEWRYNGGSYTYGGMLIYGAASLGEVIGAIVARMNEYGPYCSGPAVTATGATSLISEGPTFKFEALTLRTKIVFKGGIDGCSGGTIDSESVAGAERYKNWFCHDGQDPIMGPGESRFCVNTRNICPVTPNPVAISDGSKFYRKIVDTPALGQFEFYRSYTSLPSFSGYGLLNPPKPSLDSGAVNSPDTIGWQVSYDARMTTSSNLAGATTVFNVDIPGDNVRSYVLQPSGALVGKQNDAGTLTRNPSGEFFFRHPDLSLWRFNATKKLVSIHRPSGTSVTLQYTAEGRLTKVTDAFGRVLNVTLTAKGTIDTLTTPDGKVYEIASDAMGRFIGMRLPSAAGGATQHQYVYENAKFIGAVTGEIDELGVRVATFYYDTKGRVTRTDRHGNGGAVVSSYVIDFSTGQPKITDPLGTARTYQFQRIGDGFLAGVSQPGGSGCGAAASASSPDSFGNPIFIDDFNGSRTCKAYDTGRSLETSRVEGLPAYSSCNSYLAPNAVLPEGSRKVSTVWHPDWNLATQLAEPKKRTTYVYNGQPDPTAAGAIAHCAPVGATLPDGTPIAVMCKKGEQATSDATGAAGFAAVLAGPARTWTYTYNAFGQVLTATGPRTDIADVTAYTYDNQGNLVTVTNAAGHITTLSNYDANGKAGRITDPNGLNTDLTYSPRNWLLSKNVGGELTSYAYDGVGQSKTVTLPDASAIHYLYDDAHRLTSISDSLGNRIAYTLDAMGNRTHEQVTDPNGALARQTARVYDALNRLQQITGGQQ